MRIEGYFSNKNFENVVWKYIFPKFLPPPIFVSQMFAPQYLWQVYAAVNSFVLSLSLNVKNVKTFFKIQYTITKDANLTIAFNAAALNKRNQINLNSKWLNRVNFVIRTIRKSTRPLSTPHRKTESLMGVPDQPWTSVEQEYRSDLSFIIRTIYLDRLLRRRTADDQGNWITMASNDG